MIFAEKLRRQVYILKIKAKFVEDMKKLDQNQGKHILKFKKLLITIIKNAQKKSL